MPRNGFRLFEIFGITVYLHWSWLIIAAIELQERQKTYHVFYWNIAEYLSLFAIVLLHEFGHALACRSVGGKADRIILWPLGGVAYVQPPWRPGAMLWSIVAGPLVNVALLPLTVPFLFYPVTSDLTHFLASVAAINIVLLVFNILPIYPLDGGKILWSLLWFVMGAGNALMVASIIGIIGAVAGLALAVTLGSGDYLLIAIALFAAWQAWVGLRSAQALRRRESIPRRVGYACPACKKSPPMAPIWICARCRNQFDAFEFPGGCPACGTINRNIMCPDCSARGPIEWWGHPGTSSGPAMPPMPQMPPMPPLPPIPHNTN